jgi:peptide chain release factor
VPSFPVSEKKARELRNRMEAVQCSERDLDEKFFRGSGVNLEHRPTGLRVRCSAQTSQALNRFFARRLLIEELEARSQGKDRHEVKAERIREEKKKQKRPSRGRPFEVCELRPINPECPAASPAGLTRFLALKAFE